MTINSNIIWEQLPLEPLSNIMAADTMYQTQTGLFCPEPSITIDNLSAAPAADKLSITIGNFNIQSQPTYTIAGGNGSFSTIGATVGNSGTVHNSSISLKGPQADIDINGKSLMKTFEAFEDRLNMMVPNPKLEKEWDQLKKLGDRYRKLEKQCQDKAAMWTKLKKMPKIDIK